MKHNEYIVPIGEEAKEFDEMFIGVIRKQPELIRCKDCKWYYRGGATCMYWDGENSMRGDDYCSQAKSEEHETD